MKYFEKIARIKIPKNSEIAKVYDFIVKNTADRQIYQKASDKMVNLNNLSGVQKNKRLRELGRIAKEVKQKKPLKTNKQELNEFIGRFRGKINPEYASGETTPIYSDVYKYMKRDPNIRIRMSHNVKPGR